MHDQHVEGESKSGGKGRVDWNDPSVPCGNSPPLPRWPLVVSVVIWMAWIGFLAVMAVAASRSGPV